jgi:hypothetical protein
MIGIEPRRGRRDQWLCFKACSARIAETFLISTWHAILEFLRREQAAELAGALVGLICIVDFTIAVLCH